MLITCFVLLAAAQGIVVGYRHHTSSSYLGDDGEEDLYRDLDYWNRDDEQLDTTKAISTAEHSLAAAKSAYQAKKYAAQALAAAQQAAKAAALAGKHSKLAAHMASAAASRLAAHLSKVPGASASIGAKPGSSPAAGKKPGSSTAAGAKPGSSAGSKAGSKPGSSSGGVSRNRPTISGTPTGGSSGKGTSGAAAGATSLNVVLRFPTYRFSAALAISSSAAAKTLKARMCNAMRAVFKRGEVLQCEIKSFKSGSLLVDFFLRFAASVKDALQRIKNAIKSGYFNGLPVQKTLHKVYNVKGASPGSKPGTKICTPCNKNLAPGVKMVSQSTCPTGYCATLMINPSQVMQAAAPAQPPAYPQQPMAPPQPSYTSCPQMCQPPITQYTCPPACPPACCSTGK